MPTTPSSVTAKTHFVVNSDGPIHTPKCRESVMDDYGNEVAVRRVVIVDDYGDLIEQSDLIEPLSCEPVS